MTDWGTGETDTAGNGNPAGDEHAGGAADTWDTNNGDAKDVFGANDDFNAGGGDGGKQLTGECFKCGQVGHNKAECINDPKPFDGECRVCNETGHRANECPNKPPDICKKCNEEGHKMAQCPNSRQLLYKGVKDMQSEAAWEAMKKAVDERDIDDFKEAFKSYCKANRDITYGEMETKFRKFDIGSVYIVAIEKELPPAMTNVDLQGKEGCTYMVNFSFTKKPKRALFAVGWPESEEENIERLKDAGEPMEHLVPFCFRCKQLGHISKRCELEEVEPQPTHVVTCTNCSEEGHRMRDCPKPIIDRNTCRKCGESGHKANECEVEPSADDVECRKCKQMGHFAKDCPNPDPNLTCRNCQEQGHMAKDCGKERVIVCLNCDEHGHTARECKKPRDYSRVKCNNCGDMGHTVVKCPKPATEQDPNDTVDNTGQAGGGFGDANDTWPSADKGETNGFHESSGAADTSGW
ncbi:MAG: hypothetical protein M1831_004017 [Alyxoria varia]|nr:MAG: hypothetical protein M1831_004017 [Alyxoria varia]